MPYHAAFAIETMNAQDSTNFRSVLGTAVSVLPVEEFLPTPLLAGRPDQIIKPSVEQSPPLHPDELVAKAVAYPDVVVFVEHVDVAGADHEL